ncbi:MAG TPA: ABC transporter permease [Steroidobacteraceae bacterium]|jgi:macrolide transport system ATP-binding/permease protein|nr:ABC transporter permease [Steroidobacteraceae bacterium]
MRSQADGDEPILVVRNAAKVYRLGDIEVHALRGVSLTVRRGEFVAIMGASGSGKSTLMNILGCLDVPTSGEYLLEGIDVARLDEPALARIRGRRIGFIFQSFNLLTRTTAVENVELPLFYSAHIPGNPRRAESMLELLGLGDRKQNQPNQLSGGQQQRVAIARALVNDPAIVLADEPTGNLDSGTAADILATLRAFNVERGVTVVLVTHERALAELADRIIVIRDGSIVSDTPTARASEPPGAPTLPPAAPLREPPARGRIEAFLQEAWLLNVMAVGAALRAIGRNKLRAGLTMLGVFIGVAALIAMVAVGEGARATVESQIQSLGTDLLVVLPGSTRTNGVRAGFGSASSLRVADVGAILEQDPAVADVSYVARQSAQVVNGHNNWSTSIQGVSASYLSIRNWRVESGRALTDEDEENGDPVCLLGQTVMSNLFGDFSDPLGATVLVKNVPMVVVGVLAAKGHSPSGQDQDDVVLIPFSTAQERVLGVASPSSAQTLSNNLFATVGPPPNPFGVTPRLQGFVNTIYVQARSPAEVKPALDQITRTLEAQHRIKAGATDDFAVRDLTEIAEVAERTSAAMEVLLAAIASISLVVGGIGIMNILLVSVTERTREIGIRMATGARRAHVLMQFLIEAMLLSAMGGAAGIVAGVIASKIISSAAGWPILLKLDVIALAFVFSAAVGVFFGYYPARQASQLNPIDALRYE